MKKTHHSHHSEYSHHSHHEGSGKGQPSAPASNSKPSHDEVAQKAYEIYQREGCPQGRDLQHWLEAEAL